METEIFSGMGVSFGDHASARLQHADGSYAEPGIAVEIEAMSPAKFGVGGSFRIECIGADGVTRWVDDLKNGVTNTALNNVLDVYLRAQTQVATWYIGLVDNSGFSAFNAADTMASHTGWSEAVPYSDATRKAWSPGAAASQSVTNSTSSDFAINATATIKGLFLCSDSTKSGTTGTLFSTAAFSGGNQLVNSGDTLKVTYTVSATSS